MATEEAETEDAAEEAAAKAEEEAEEAARGAKDLANEISSSVDATYEHGQWWVQFEVGTKAYTFSVVQVEINGDTSWDLEQV